MEPSTDCGGRHPCNALKRDVASRQTSTDNRRVTRSADGPRWAQRSQLTRRELEILEFVVARYTNAEIAGALTISKRTVESHVSALRRKVGVSDRPTLIEVGGRLTATRPGRVPRPPVDAADPPESPRRDARFAHPGFVTSGASMEALEARYRLRELAAATRAARTRAAGLRTRSMARVQASMEHVSRTHTTLERTYEAINLGHQ